MDATYEVEIVLYPIKDSEGRLRPEKHLWFRRETLEATDDKGAINQIEAASNLVFGRRKGRLKANGQA